MHMAEICLECFSKYFLTGEYPSHYLVSKDMDLCEECGQLKPVVIRKKYKHLFADALRQRIDYWKAR